MWLTLIKLVKLNAHFIVIKILEITKIDENWRRFTALWWILLISNECLGKFIKTFFFHSEHSLFSKVFVDNYVRVRCCRWAPKFFNWALAERRGRSTRGRPWELELLIYFSRNKSNLAQKHKIWKSILSSRIHRCCGIFFQGGGG